MEQKEIENLNKNLPKEGWYVKNDCSQLFKNSVINYINALKHTTLCGGGHNFYYGLDDNKRLPHNECVEDISNFGSNAKELTIQEFIELSKEVEENKVLKLDDLVEGEIYKFKGLFNWIFKYKKDGVYIKDTFRIEIGSKTFDKDGSFGSDIKNVSLASQQEKDWLNTCIKEDKFVSLEEINSKPTPEILLEEAKRRFPIGTKFYPAHLNQKIEYCIVTEDSVFILSNNEITLQVNNSSFNYDIKYGSTIYNRIIYSKNCWAEIVSTSVKSEFKKDDYIVLGNTPDKASFLSNCCYKQREDNIYLKSYLDSKLSKINGWTCVSIDNSNGSENVFNWRYATKEESEYYEKIGEPFDTTGKEFKDWYNSTLRLEHIKVILGDINDISFKYTKGFYPEVHASKATIIEISNAYKGDKVLPGSNITINHQMYTHSNPSSEPKEFDRNFYVEVKSQEEYEKVCKWLKSKGEILYNEGNCIYNSKWSCMGYYRDKWVLSMINNKNKPLKTLSDLGIEEDTKWVPKEETWVEKVKKEDLTMIHPSKESIKELKTILELYNPKKSNALDTSIKPIKSISTNLIEKKKVLLF